MKRLLTLILAFAMLLSMAAIAESDYPTYLNLDSQIPVVKEGEEAPVLKVMVTRQAGGGDWDDLWVAHYIEEYLNVKLDVEMIEGTEALAERKNLMFASGDLPDLMLNMDFTTDELVTYGQMNGQLLAMEDYVNETLTPNMVQWFEENPAAKALATAPDGHMYTLPHLLELDNEGDLRRQFVNTTWLDELGLEAPTTLDDFLAMLRAMKEAHPESTPLNGAIDEQNPGYFILNAMGYVCRSLPDAGYGLDPAVRNGKFELPCYSELFEEYLRIMHDLYDEGIIIDDFFLADKTKVDANVTNNSTAVVNGTPYSYGISTWADWEAISPLTSEWNDTPVVNLPTPGDVGEFAISADTQYPELCMRFADVFFSHDHVARMMWIGPKDGSEEALGYPGNVASAGGEGWSFPETSYPEGVTDLWSWLVGHVSFYAGFGSDDTQRTINAYASSYLGGDELPYKQFDMTNGDQFYRASVWEKVYPYVTENTFPASSYLTEEESLLKADLLTVIEPYVKQQVAMFIKGDRPLEEFDAYIEELKGMGIEQLVDIYTGIWESYRANL